MYIYHKPNARIKQGWKRNKPRKLSGGLAPFTNGCRPPEGAEKHRKGRFLIDVEASKQLNQN